MDINFVDLSSGFDWNWERNGVILNSLMAHFTAVREFETNKEHMGLIISNPKSLW